MRRLPITAAFAAAAAFAGLVAAVSASALAGTPASPTCDSEFAAADIAARIAARDAEDSRIILAAAQAGNMARAPELLRLEERFRDDVRAWRYAAEKFRAAATACASDRRAALAQRRAVSADADAARAANDSDRALLMVARSVR